MHRRTLAVIFFALSVLPLSAAAETYLDLSLSLVLPASDTVSGVPRAPAEPPLSESIDLTTESGFGITGAWGVRRASGWRNELELGYRSTRTDAFETPDESPLIWPADNPNAYETRAPATGDVVTTSLMANAYGSFGEGNARPYLGAGLGAALLAYDIRTRDDTTDVRGLLYRGRGNTLTDEAVVFAWQVMAGVEYGALRLGYRYFATQDVEVDGLDITHARHAVEVGVRF